MEARFCKHDWSIQKGVCDGLDLIVFVETLKQATSKDLRGLRAVTPLEGI